MIEIHALGLGFGMFLEGLADQDRKWDGKDSASNLCFIISFSSARSPPLNAH